MIDPEALENARQEAVRLFGTSIRTGSNRDAVARALIAIGEALQDAREVSITVSTNPDGGESEPTSSPPQIITTPSGARMVVLAEADYDALAAKARGTMGEGQ